MTENHRLPASRFDLLAAAERLGPGTPDVSGRWHFTFDALELSVRPTPEAATAAVAAFGSAGGPLDEHWTATAAELVAWADERGVPNELPSDPVVAMVRSVAPAFPSLGVSERPASVNLHLPEAFVSIDRSAVGALRSGKLVRFLHGSTVERASALPTIEWLLVLAAEAARVGNWWKGPDLPQDELEPRLDELVKGLLERRWGFQQGSQALLRMLDPGLSREHLEPASGPIIVRITEAVRRRRAWAYRWSPPGGDAVTFLREMLGDRRPWIARWPGGNLEMEFDGMLVTGRARIFKPGRRLKTTGFVIDPATAAWIAWCAQPKLRRRFPQEDDTEMLLQAVLFDGRPPLGYIKELTRLLRDISSKS